MLTAGIISEVLADRGKVRVALPDQDGTDTYDLPVLQRNTRGNRHYHLPDVGEQVYVALDDNGEDGCVLGSIYSEADPAPLADNAQTAMIFEDSTTVKYDRNAHLMTVEFGDGTSIQYDAQAHDLRLTVSSNGTINVTCAGRTKVTSKAIELSAVESIALNAPAIALNTAALTCTDPTAEHGYCNAAFKGNVTVESQSFNVASAAMTLKAPVAVQGSLTATGSITAAGSILDGGSNTNHHTHPQYQLI